jgi:hypothetical protein
MALPSSVINSSQHSSCPFVEWHKYPYRITPLSYQLVLTLVATPAAAADGYFCLVLLLIDS